VTTQPAALAAAAEGTPATNAADVAKKSLFCTSVTVVMKQQRRWKGIHTSCTTEQHEARCSPSVGAATTVANGRADRYALSEAAKPALLGF
jgi:hypothetical protein